MKNSDMPAKQAKSRERPIAVVAQDTGLAGTPSLGTDSKVWISWTDDALLLLPRN